ncbi:helix-turn-helix transcriptional regulator [uncultured Jatrophihabitans sp.]|uniref:helix-turn-helix transcriptional regulator n=1 Tax=uncultured Jatrophihabitans sp. TaxID=1610747 RepID=UPI0035C990F4
MIGHHVEEFTTDAASGALDLFASGRVTGYETTRMLRRREGDSLAVSVRMLKFDHQSRARFALAVFSVPDTPVVAEPWSDSGQPLVVGTTDKSLVIERETSGGSAPIRESTAKLLGQPLTNLVAEDERGQLAAAIDAAAATHRAVTVRMREPTVAGVNGLDAVHQLMILPMAPPPGCAFVLLRLPEISAVVPPAHAPDRAAPDLSGLLLQLHSGAAVAGLADRFGDLSDRDLPGLSELSPREWEIVGRLLAGDRVPAIATALYLSPSTVRSHLGLVFAKLHVGSQQELLDLLRRKPAPSA